MGSDHGSWDVRETQNSADRMKHRQKDKLERRDRSSSRENTLSELDMNSDTTAMLANSSEASTTLTEGEDDDEGLPDQPLATHTVNSGLEIVYNLGYDDHNSSSDVDDTSGTTSNGHQRLHVDKTSHDTISTSIPFRHRDDPPTSHDCEEQADSGTLHAPPRVRFRSRVRITSGLRRQRSGAFSVDSSPSSSISAPLRYSQSESESPHLEGAARESVKRSFYGDFARNRARRNKPPSHVVPPPPQGKKRYNVRRGNSSESSETSDERAPLSSSAGWQHASYIRSLMRGDMDDDSEEDGEGLAQGIQRRAQTAQRLEEEAIYGKWPLRIFNHHWWKKKLEPTSSLCCCNVNYSDSDEGG